MAFHIFKIERSILNFTSLSNYILIDGIIFQTSLNPSKSGSNENQQGEPYRFVFKINGVFRVHMLSELAIHPQSPLSNFLYVILHLIKDIDSVQLVYDFHSYLGQ